MFPNTIKCKREPALNTCVKVFNILSFSVVLFYLVQFDEKIVKIVRKNQLITWISDRIIQKGMSWKVAPEKYHK